MCQDYSEIKPLRKLTPEEGEELKRRLTEDAGEMPRGQVPRHWVWEKFVWLGDAVRIIESRTGKEAEVEDQRHDELKLMLEEIDNLQFQTQFFTMSDAARSGMSQTVSRLARIVERLLAAEGIARSQDTTE